MVLLKQCCGATGVARKCLERGGATGEGEPDQNTPRGRGGGDAVQI